MQKVLEQLTHVYRHYLKNKKINHVKSIIIEKLSSLEKLGFGQAKPVLFVYFHISRQSVSIYVYACRDEYSNTKYS